MQEKITLFIPFKNITLIVLRKNFEKRKQKGQKRELWNKYSFFSHF